MTTMSWPTDVIILYSAIQSVISSFHYFIIGTFALTGWICWWIHGVFTKQFEVK